MLGVFDLREPMMVEIRPGEDPFPLSFWMGSREDDPQAQSDEMPRHEVELSKPFAIGKFEVTFEEYEAFVQMVRSSEPFDGGWGRGRRPVILVAWQYARNYARWLSLVTGKDYRLPTEAEWEYAARSGARTTYWWADEIGENRVNCRGCGSQWDGRQTAS